jgi:AcrR family transcriptional regulator
MVQVKKAEVRDAILEAAFSLFEEKSYAGTSIAEIGRAAGVAPSGIYIYFKSKLDLFYAVYEPWLKDRLIALEHDVEQVSGHRAKVRRIIEAIWLDIPNECNFFANNLIQAVSTASPVDGYSGELLDWCEGRVAGMLKTSLPPGRRSRTDHAQMAHIIFMAFDGFAVRSYLGVRAQKMRTAIDTMTDLILGNDTAPKLVPVPGPGGTD